MVLNSRPARGLEEVGGVHLPARWTSTLTALPALQGGRDTGKIKVLLLFTITLRLTLRFINFLAVNYSCDYFCTCNFLYVITQEIAVKHSHVSELAELD